MASLSNTDSGEADIKRWLEDRGPKSSAVTLSAMPIGQAEDAAGIAARIWPKVFVEELGAIIRGRENSQAERQDATWITKQLVLASAWPDLQSMLLSEETDETTIGYGIDACERWTNPPAAGESTATLPG